MRRASNTLCQANKRVYESECDAQRRREKDRCSTASARALTKSIDVVIQEFLAKVKVGPDYVCTCCHRMLYRHAVIGFKPTKYTKASPELLTELSEHAYVGSDGKQWVCKTCDGALSRGNLPVQAKANGMELDNQPANLSCLNALEQRLISLRVPFMKMVALPSGKQRCIHGPAVNVPSNVDRVCTMLPRLPSECELVPLKLKRKLSYKGHYLYDYVSPQKLINALKWLKANNPLYADVDIADDWVGNALADDEELVMSMIEQPESMEQNESTDIANSVSLNNGSDTPCQPSRVRVLCVQSIFNNFDCRKRPKLPLFAINPSAKNLICVLKSPLLHFSLLKIEFSFWGVRSVYIASNSTFQRILKM